MNIEKLIEELNKKYDNIYFILDSDDFPTLQVTAIFANGNKLQVCSGDEVSCYLKLSMFTNGIEVAISNNIKRKTTND